MKCPNCQFNNPEDTFFCGKCAASLRPHETPPSPPTLTPKPPSEGLQAGTMFAGRYQVIEELGRGGMGRVYKVYDAKIKEKIALKLINPEIASETETIERFSNEIRLARKIRHKNVCQMYDISEFAGTHFITMEYVAGEDLKSMLRMSRELSLSTAVRIVKQVCQGLTEAHRSGVVHRDLKPSNIMIDKDGIVRIMDFGIARSVRANEMTGAGIMVGTPAYMSPEQAAGLELDQRADIYSLGVVLYEMTTGRRPFSADTALGLVLQHETQPVPDPRKFNPQIPDDLSRLILRCLEKDKEQRYPRVDDLLADLIKVERGIPAAEHPADETRTITLQKPPRLLARKKVWYPALIVLAFAVAALIIFKMWPQRTSAPTPSAKPSLAVMYFKNNTGDPSLDNWRIALSDLLIADLSQSKYLRILSGASLFNILNQLNQLDATTFSSDVLKEVSVRGKANYVLVGDYSKAGDKFRLNALVQDAATAELLGSETAEGTSQASFFTMVDELTRKIKTRFRLSSGEMAADIDEDIRMITTGSPDAYTYYSEGLQFYRKGDYRRTIEFMERAKAIDPEFAMADRLMAYAYGTLGYADEQMKYLQKALLLKDRISERERLLIEGDFYRHREDTAGRAIAAYTTLLRLYPEEWRGNLNLGILYHDLEDFVKAVDRFERNMQSETETYYASLYLAQSYAALGRYDQGRQVLEGYLRRYSDNAITRWYLAQNSVCLGKYDLALIDAEKASQLNPGMYQNQILKGDIRHLQGEWARAEQEYRKLLEKEEPAARIYGRLSLAALYLARGRFGGAIAELEQANTLAGEMGETSTEFGFLRYLASVYLKSGKSDKASEVIEKAGRIAATTGDFTEKKSYLYDRAIIDLEGGRLTESAKSAEELKKLISESANPKEIRHYDFIIGMIELKKKDYGRAAKFFRKALSLVPSQYAVNNEHAPFRDGLAAAYFGAGELDKAQSEYQKIMELTVARLYYGDVYAKSFYWLGRIQEQRGIKTKARESYQRFLALWEEADPGLPEVGDARRRMEF